MKLTEQQKQFQQVVQEAWENETFKKELIANPVAAIEKLIGKKLNIPEGKTLVVRDQTSEDTVYINIPAEPNMENVELNEEQLEAVAGGQAITNVIGEGYPPIDIFPIGPGLGGPGTFTGEKPLKR